MLVNVFSSELLRSTFRYSAITIMEGKKTTPEQRISPLSVSEDEIKSIVGEQIEKMVDDIIDEEIEKEITKKFTILIQ